MNVTNESVLGHAQLIMMLAKIAKEIEKKTGIKPGAASWNLPGVDKSLVDVITSLSEQDLERMLQYIKGNNHNPPVEVMEILAKSDKAVFESIVRELATEIEMT